MSENSDTPDGTVPDATESGTASGTASAGAPATAPGPQPESIRFFGTTWVAHDGNYGLRRAGVAIGSLAAAVASCFVLRFAYQGLEIADVGSFVGLLVVLMFAICSAVAFRKTWEGFSRRPADPGREDTLRGLKTIGFIGSLLAYFFRTFSEAPGEKLRRTEYEAAQARFAKRRSARTGNPAARRTAKAKKARRR
ncbi:hypothetical protein ABT025_36725 [Streptomyces sp. NPDC002809]|uniref:hypothetical protein n=1 Tax=Streptomyces sp. NPDC002809 TaxID=3154433 RepID=UPI003319FA7C